MAPPEDEERRPLLSQAPEPAYGSNSNSRDIRNGEAQETQSQHSVASSTRDRLSHFCGAISHGKNLLIVCLLLLLALVLAIFVSLIFHERHYHPVQKTCQSPECILAAAGILESLHPEYETIDACTDFDRLVCGGWERNHDLRPDQGDMFTGTLMNERSKSQLRHILEGEGPELDGKGDKEIFAKLKGEYESCMDEGKLKSVGLQPLLGLLEQVETAFPLKNSTTKGKGPTNDLTSALILLTKLDIGALLEFGVSADDRDPDTQIIMVTPPSAIGLPTKEYYSDDDLVAKYRKMTATTFKAFGLKKKLASRVVQLEIQLAAITPPEEDQADVTKYYNPRTVAETTTLLPEVSFEYLISDLAPKGYSASKLIIGSPSYMKSLSKILSETPRETLQAFFIWKTIQTYENLIESPKLHPLQAFNNQLRGLDADAKPERWQTCINALDEDLGWILSRFYILTAFSESAKNFGDQIVSDIKSSFIHTLKNTPWITPAVRAQAIAKVHAIDQKIGYPTHTPDVLSAESVAAYYSNLNISSTSFFNNSLSATIFSTSFSWQQLAAPTDHTLWDMTTPTVNAYYNPAGNEIVFPAGIMQAPVFYPPSVPYYLSYGAFGAVAGHELSHAFDSTGAHYDERGNYSEWFDKPSQKAFQERTKCFEDQYANFTVPAPHGPLHVNGHLTLGENLADAAGLSAAFHAWRVRSAIETKSHPKSKPGKEVNLRLPGLDHFSPEQLFFVGYASWWCDKSTPEKAVERVYTDPHAPKWARIRGGVGNSREFKRVFGCQDREPVCRLW